jgi:hypothetical protein
MAATVRTSLLMTDYIYIAKICNSCDFFKRYRGFYWEELSLVPSLLGFELGISKCV